MPNPAWLPNTQWAPGAVIIDPNGNVQQTLDGGFGGPTPPTFSSLNLGDITLDRNAAWVLTAIISPASAVPNVLASLPVPDFIGDADGLDPNLVLGDMITEFEASTGRTLYPAQVERLLINLYAYREVLLRLAIQYCGTQNLLAFASYPVLDYIGQLLSVPRSAGQPAVVTLEIELTAALTVSYTLPQGWEVATADGQFVFALNNPVTFQPGQTALSVNASCTEVGPNANGYLPGTIDVIVNGDALVASATNISTSSGGAVPETDDDYRAQIQLAPNKFSVAGPQGAYQYFAKAVDPAIIDVQVVSSDPGVVDVFILTGPITNLPFPSGTNPQAVANGALLDKVAAALNDVNVRPLTDTVNVHAITQINYSITATVTLYADADPTATQAAVLQAAMNYATSMASRIERDVIVNQIIAALSIPGVYDVVVSVPVSDAFSSIGAWNNLQVITLTFSTADESS